VKLGGVEIDTENSKGLKKRFGVLALRRRPELSLPKISSGPNAFEISEIQE